MTAALGPSLVLSCTNSSAVFSGDSACTAMAAVIIAAAAKKAVFGTSQRAAGDPACDRAQSCRALGDNVGPAVFVTAPPIGELTRGLCADEILVFLVPLGGPVGVRGLRKIDYICILPWGCASRDIPARR